MPEVELYEWIQWAMQMADPCCTVHKKTKLELVWLVDQDDELVLWYIRCPRKDCNREYSIQVGVVPIIIGEE
ncbi:MAG: hypothetical protein H0U60_19965 [Blastocatellia bacterium]|nr:hypothetical protein [Blastocatellia bacterium]